MRTAALNRHNFKDEANFVFPAQNFFTALPTDVRADDYQPQQCPYNLRTGKRYIINE